MRLLPDDERVPELVDVVLADGKLRSQDVAAALDRRRQAEADVPFLDAVDRHADHLIPGFVRDLGVDSCVGEDDGAVFHQRHQQQYAGGVGGGVDVRLVELDLGARVDLQRLVVDGPGWQYELIGEHWAWYLVDTVALLLLSGQLARIPLLQRLLTTSGDQAMQVDMRAQIEFYQSNLHATADATGVLLLVSLMEHRAVVLADTAIDSKVPSETWDEVIEVTIDGIKKGHVGLGLAAAIERCGDILATEFPIGEDDVNELKDTLIIRE